jgi:hypothetical protein
MVDMQTLREHSQSPRIPFPMKVKELFTSELPEKIELDFDNALFDAI